MPTLKLGSTTELTESSGALTINVANPTVTLGSNATFNAPNLGTPSAVTLTNATFPAGHVIQVQQRMYASSSSSVATTTLTKALSSSVAQYYVTIDNVDANNNVFLIMTCAVWKTSSNWPNTGSGYGIFRGDTAIFETQSYADNMRWASHSNNNESANCTTIQFLDTSPSAGSNTYYFGLRTDHSYNSANILGGNNVFTAMEIKG